MREALRHKKRALFVVHRRELVKQTAARLAQSGIKPADIGLVLGGVPASPRAPIQVASIEAWVKRSTATRADVVIIDEAHHATSKSYRALIEGVAGHARVYGLTATPYRLDGKPLGDIFDALIESAPPSKLVDAGWLLRPRVYTVPQGSRADLVSVVVNGADFNQRQLARAVNRHELIGDIVAHYQRYAEGRPAVCYAVNLEHGVSIVDRFLAHDVTAALIDGSTPDHERSRLLQALSDGALQVLVNCMVLTEGWDCPQAKLAIVARPTMSRCLWVQMTGRITRPNPGSVAAPLVLDHAGNAIVHGLPLVDEAFSLRDSIHRGTYRPSFGSVPEKCCPECECSVAVITRVCPNCGYEFWRIEETDGQLVELSGQRFCQWDGCLTPGVPVSASHRDKPGAMHMACIRARSLAARRCQYEHCPTPEKLLTKRRTEMHRSCASARARARRRTSLCERCGNPLELGEDSKARLHDGCRKQASHGSRARYVKGCRCVECRKANVAYQREYVRTRTAQAAPGSTVRGV